MKSPIVIEVSSDHDNSKQCTKRSVLLCTPAGITPLAKQNKNKSINTAQRCKEAFGIGIFPKKNS